MQSIQVLLLVASLATPAGAAEIPVSSAVSLIKAINDVAPGDEIVIASGAYELDQTLYCDIAGDAALPITVRAEEPGTVTLSVDATVGFEVSAPYWTFQDLEVRGACADHTSCEHAFHITGEADHTTVRNCVLVDYNAQIKGNGDTVGGTMTFPDDVLIENSEIYNTSPRETGNPVTPIDVVGGQRWIVRANFIHDHEKSRSDRISYAAFFKGNSRDGIFERNLVVCEFLHSGGIRLGLSFGGGGSYPDSICEDSNCDVEHHDGIMRNNIIANCPADVGIYLNEAENSLIYNNTIYNTTGIDVRFSVSTAVVANNILDGEIRDRDGSTVTSIANLEGISLSQWDSWFESPEDLDFSLLDGSQIVDAGENFSEVTDDFCTNDRDDGATDIGAVEYDGDSTCDTTVPYEATEGDDHTGDTAATDTAANDTAATDSGSTDTAVTDSGSTDTGAADCVPEDSDPTINIVVTCECIDDCSTCGCQSSAGQPSQPPRLLSLLTAVAGCLLWKRRRLVRG